MCAYGETGYEVIQAKWRVEERSAQKGSCLLRYNTFFLHSGGWNQGPLDTAAT
jgi:hypothetical protein